MKMEDYSKEMYKVQKIEEKCIKSELILSQFEGLSEELICPICLDIVWHPICCLNCSSPYGDKCLNNWFKYNSLCPKQCKFEKSEVNLLLKRIINKIEFNCLYKENGCNTIIKYEHFYHHVNSCDFANYRCSAEGCEIQGSRQTLIEHLKICEFGIEKCTTCSITLKRKEFFEHKSDIKNCMKVFEAKIEKLEDNNSQLEKENNKLESLLLKNQTHLNKMNDTITDLSKENSALKNANLELSEAVDQVSSKNISLSSKNNELEIAKWDYDNKVKDLKTKLKAIEEAHMDVIQKVENLTLENYGLKKKIFELIKASTIKENNIVNLNLEFDNLNISSENKLDNSNKIDKTEEKLSENNLISYYKNEVKKCTHILVLEEMKKDDTYVHCDICLKQNIQISWGCRICDFDACIVCYAKEFSNQKVVCNNKHLLTATMFTPTELINVEICEYCKDEITSGNTFSCKECNFFVCHSCYLVKEKSSTCLIF